MHHVLALIAGRLSVPESGVGIFGGQNHARAMAFGELAQKRLARAV